MRYSVFDALFYFVVKRYACMSWAVCSLRSTRSVAGRSQMSPPSVVLRVRYSVPDLMKKEKSNLYWLYQGRWLEESSMYWTVQLHYFSAVKESLVQSHVNSGNCVCVQYLKPLGLYCESDTVVWVIECVCVECEALLMSSSCASVKLIQFDLSSGV